MQINPLQNIISPTFVILASVFDNKAFDYKILNDAVDKLEKFIVVLKQYANNIKNIPAKKLENEYHTIQQLQSLFRATSHIIAGNATDSRLKVIKEKINSLVEILDDIVETLECYMDPDLLSALNDYLENGTKNFTEWNLK